MEEEEEKNNKLPELGTTEFLKRHQQAHLKETKTWLKNKGPELETLLDTIIGETDNTPRPGPG